MFSYKILNKNKLKLKHFDFKTIKLSKFSIKFSTNKNKNKCNIKLNTILILSVLYYIFKLQLAIKLVEFLLWGLRIRIVINIFSGNKSSLRCRQFLKGRCIIMIDFVNMCGLCWRPWWGIRLIMVASILLECWKYFDSLCLKECWIQMAIVNLDCNKNLQLELKQFGM